MCQAFRVENLHLDLHRSIADLHRREAHDTPRLPVVSINLEEDCGLSHIWCFTLANAPPVRQDAEEKQTGQPPAALVLPYF